MNLVEKIMTEVDNLPSFPMVYTALSNAMEDPMVTSDKLSTLISSDPAAAMKILKVVNSPIYGLRGKIDTITQAILFLGFREVKNIVFALSVMNFFSKEKRLVNFRPMDFWAHSVGVGIATRMIGRAIGEKNLENFFLAGMFHDIGKLLFLEFAHEEYAKVLEVVENKNCRIKDAELEVLGLDHARAGKLLAAKWKLSSGIQNTIYYHHEGTLPDSPNSLVAAVHVGNIIARITSLGYPGDNLVPEPNIDVWDQLNLPKGFFTSMRKELQRNIENTTKMMMD